MSHLARGRRLSTSLGAAITQSVQAVPRVAFQAGCSLAYLASQAGIQYRDEYGGDKAAALPAEPLCITGTPDAGMLPLIALARTGCATSCSWSVVQQAVHTPSIT